MPRLAIGPAPEPIDTPVLLHILFEADALEPARTVCPDCFALDGLEILSLVAYDVRYFRTHDFGPDVPTSLPRRRKVLSLYKCHAAVLSLSQVSDTAIRRCDFLFLREASEFDADLPNWYVQGERDATYGLSRL